MNKPIMLLFPNAKINVGLRILRRRGDGYHDIASLFHPLQYADFLEIIEAGNAPGPAPLLQVSGFPVPADENNLCLQALRLMRERHEIPEVRIHLHKRIPPGGGLAGGSSDAAHVLKGLNRMFGLELPDSLLAEYAAILGSDCPFFIQNRTAMVGGRGERIEPAGLDLQGCHLLLLVPGFHVSTRDAYQQVRPRSGGPSITAILNHPVEEWKGLLVNDFETTLFPRYPELSELKEALYAMGAAYASMTGSGAGLYGIFRTPPPREINIPGLRLVHRECL